MAKPGRQARQFTARARDLSRVRLTDEQIAEQQEKLEIAKLLRCGGCGMRIGRGFHFTSMALREESPILQLAACARAECDFATVCREGATYVEQVEYAWLDELGVDASPAKVIRERDERHAAERAAHDAINGTVEGLGSAHERRATGG